MIKVEFTIYVLIWIGIFCKACYEIYLVNAQGLLPNDYKSTADDTYGLNRKRYEHMWKYTLSLVTKGIKYFALYLLVSKILRKCTSPMIFMSGCTVLAISFNLYLTSVRFVLLELLILMIAIVFGIFKLKPLVWICQLIMLYNLNRIWNYEFFHIEPNDLLSVPLAYLVLLITRSISVGLLLADTSNESKLSWKSLVECFYFYWYFPALIGCRMMTIRDFIRQVYEPYKIPDKYQWTLQLIKCTLVAVPVWHVFVCLFPTRAILQNTPVQNLDPFIVNGGQLVHGIHFYMVYYIIYNIVYRICQFDGFETTKGPVCIAHIAVYSTIWSEFDRGLYAWVKCHIVDPFRLNFRNNRELGGILGGLLAFGFVLIFHGMRQDIFAFVALNTVQYGGERLIKYIYRSTSLGSTLKNRLSEYSLVRLEGIFSTLSFTISAAAFGSMRYGYSKVQEIVSYEFYEAIDNANYFPLLLAIIICYCHGQISVWTKHWRQLKNY